MATWPVLAMHAIELRRADNYGPLHGDEIIPVYSPAGHRRSREGSLPLTVIQPHIVRHVIGTSDCPMIEASTDGESVNNAAKLKLALETYGHLDAGPFGAVYDLAFTAPDMVTTPVVSIEGNGSQTFKAIPADYINSPLNPPSGVAGPTGRNTQYGPGAVMFSFEGRVNNNHTLTASIDWGGDAYLRGIKIIGPPLAPGVGYWNNVICGRFINRLTVEDCDIFGWTFGSLIRVTAVRNGGSLSHNYLHDCTINYVRSFSSVPADHAGDTTQLTGILMDDELPTDGTLLNADVGTPPVGPQAPMLNAIAHSADFLMEENKIIDLVDLSALKQTDGINIQMRAENIRIKGGQFRNLGDAIDIWSSRSIVDGCLIDNCMLGVKAIYNFNNGIISNNNITNSGQYGIMIGASGRDGWGNENNIITGNNVVGVRGLGGLDGTTPVTAACFGTIFNPLTKYGAVKRLFVHGNTFDPNGPAFTVLMEAEGEHHHVHNNLELIRNGGKMYANSNRATMSTHSAVGDTSSFNYVLAYLASDLTEVTGNGEDVLLAPWNEFTDRSEEFDAATGTYTVSELGNYRITFLVTFTNVAPDIKSLVVLVRCQQGVGHRDWSFQAGDPPPTSFAEVCVTGTVDEKFVVVGGTIQLHALAVGTSSVTPGTVVGIKSRSSQFQFSSLTIMKV